MASSNPWSRVIKGFDFDGPWMQLRRAVDIRTRKVAAANALQLEAARRRARVV